MYTEDDDLAPPEMERLLRDAVAVALTHEDPQRFMDWMQENMANYETGAEGPLGPAGFLGVASVLGRLIWNAIPLPGNNFKPRPLPELGRNDRCPCGSGRKYKQCCALLPPLMPLENGALWPLVLEAVSPRQVRDALAHRLIPVEALAELAEDYMDENRYRKAVALLEPAFEDIRDTGDTQEYALTLLCNCYDELGFHRKKTALLERIIDTANRSPLRGGAWQRMATIFMDKGRTDQAWDAFRHAQKDDPDSLAVGVLEIQLLVAQNRLQEARARATFWLKRLQRMGLTNEHPGYDFFKSAAEDPLALSAELGMHVADGAGARLRDWLVSVSDRRVPCYKTDGESMPAPEDPPGLFGDDADDAGPGLFLVAPAKVVSVEKKWQEVFLQGKPFSVNDVPFDHDEEVWNPFVEEVWTGFLDRHPEAFDSLDIIDDLATAVILHPQFGATWLDHTLLEPLLSRAEAIIDAALAGVASPRMSWFFEDSRPALRSLARLAALYLRLGNGTAASQRAQRLLELNPVDNHGFRALVINDHLRAGGDDQALALAARYADDLQPEIAYGRVLALYRQGRTDDALAALNAAQVHLPKVVRYLAAERVREPAMSEFGVTLGGDDQAWLYRTAMRDVWQATPGVLAWLKKAAVRKRPAARS